MISFPLNVQLLPLEFKKKEAVSPPRSLFNSLVSLHVSPHLVIWKLCSVITWHGGGFTVHFALCSFPPFLSCLFLLGYLPLGFRLVLLGFSFLQASARFFSFCFVLVLRCLSALFTVSRVISLPEKKQPVLYRLEEHSLPHTHTRGPNTLQMCSH